MDGEGDRSTPLHPMQAARPKAASEPNAVCCRHRCCNPCCSIGQKLPVPVRGRMGGDGDRVWVRCLGGMIVISIQWDHCMSRPDASSSHPKPQPVQHHAGTQEASIGTQGMCPPDWIPTSLTTRPKPSVEGPNGWGGHSHGGEQQQQQPQQGAPPALGLDWMEANGGQKGQNCGSPVHGLGV